VRIKSPRPVHTLRRRGSFLGHSTACRAGALGRIKDLWHGPAGFGGLRDHHRAPGQARWSCGRNTRAQIMQSGARLCGGRQRMATVDWPAGQHCRKAADRRRWRPGDGPRASQRSNSRQPRADRARAGFIVIVQGGPGQSRECVLNATRQSRTRPRVSDDSHGRTARRHRLRRAAPFRITVGRCRVAGARRRVPEGAAGARFANGGLMAGRER